MASESTPAGLDRARSVQELFEAVVELEEAERSAFLGTACGHDLALREEVEALLRLLPCADTREVFPPISTGALRDLDAPAPSRADVRACLPPAEWSAPSGQAAVALAELRCGDQMGRYKVLRRIGAGGMGTVYAAYDTVLKRNIALKFLSAFPCETAAVPRLLAEARAMARLSHPNVVTVHDVGTLAGQPFMAMEYVNGVTLGEWRRERPRSVRQVMDVMAAVARGLAVAHSAGIIHRDIKPSNILVDGVRVLVTDFGLSVHDQADIAGDSGVAGTPGYMAPEQLRGDPVTSATDVFGFCATLFEMLHLRPPFGTGSLADVLSRMEAEHPLSVRPGVQVPKRVQRLLRAGLARDPSARPTSMGAIATALQADPARLARRVAWLTIGASMMVAAFWAGHRPEVSPPAPQLVSGPAWVQHPQPIPATMFGVTLQSATGAMPSFQVGAVRLWDSGTRWASIQPRRGEFDWTTLDRLVEAAGRARLPVLFTIGGTPSWAAPAGARGPYPDGSRTSAPDQIADWQAFIEALAARYQGRIEAYEVWVLGNDDRFYSGPLEKLVEMTRLAYQTIKSAAPDALVVCPGMGRLSTAEGQRIMRRFAELDGYRYCEIASIKLYQRSASDPPETMLGLVSTADAILHEAGVHPPMWNTGTAYEIPLQGSLDAAMATRHAVRFFLVGLYARLERMYFYNWGGTKIPIVLQADGGSPTAAALAVQQLQRWLQQASIRSCGEGPPAGLPESVWQCEVTVTVEGETFDAAIRWTHQGRRAMPIPPDATAVHHLDGTSERVSSGGTIVLSEEPIFIEYGTRGGKSRQRQSSKIR